MAEMRLETGSLDPLVEKLGTVKNGPVNTLKAFSSLTSQISSASAYGYEKRLASLTKQYTQQVRQKERMERKRQESIQVFYTLLMN